MWLFLIAVLSSIGLLLFVVYAYAYVFVPFFGSKRREARRLFDEVRVHTNSWDKDYVSGWYRDLHHFVLNGPDRRTCAVFRLFAPPNEPFQDLENCLLSRGFRATRVSLINGIVVLSLSGNERDWQHDAYEVLFTQEREDPYWKNRLSDEWARRQAEEARRQAEERAREQERARESFHRAQSAKDRPRPTGRRVSKADRRFTCNGRPIARCYYSVLEVDPRARQALIDRAYRLLMQDEHPDHGGLHDTAVEINSAYKVLGNPAFRERYNRENGYR